MTTLIPVCALCRRPLGVGMKIVIFHPDQYRRYAAANGLREYDDDDPIACCLPCGNKIQFSPSSRGPS